MVPTDALQLVATFARQFCARPGTAQTQWCWRARLATCQYSCEHGRRLFGEMHHLIRIWKNNPWQGLREAVKQVHIGWQRIFGTNCRVEALHAFAHE
eukprot:4425006-Prymnesium_polylepis.1